MPTRRLFYALWLPDPVAESLHRQARALPEASSARAMRPETLHLTLVFLGDVEDARLPTLCAIGRQVASGRPAFSLAIDRLGHWSHNRIDWAGCATVPPELDALVADLRAALASAGFPFEARPFVPHITLLRKRGLDTLPDDFSPHRLRIDELRLVESTPGQQGAYVPVERWAQIA